jgi:putative FmdB family regulatory protein
MPIYEYECPDCKFYTEVIQKISDKPLARCPSCGSRRFTRLISAPIFRLKGSGWYETDFKSDRENKRNLAAEDKEAAAEAKTDTKTETKSEAKTDSKPDAKAEPVAKSPARARRATKSGARAGSRPAGVSRAKAKAVLRRATPARKK